LTKKKVNAPSSSSRPSKSKKNVIYAAMGIIVVIAIAIGLFMDNNSGKNNNDDLSNNNNELVENSRIAAIDKFENQFCGNNSNPNSNQYVTEYVLPTRCEMPLGIAVDNNASKVWYISTKNGTLGSYNIKENRFDQERTIPIWKSRQNPIDSSQVWTVKVDRENNIWFTDEKQNSIWRYNNLLKTFEFFNIPGISESFGTTYPVSLDFDSSGNIYFVGIRSTSLWFGNIKEMKNGTSDGISQIPIPLQGFAGIDPDLISTGSLVVDENNNSVWLSMLAFAKKGLIFKYDINSKTFEVFNLPPDLNSPVGIALENNNNNSDLWITDHGTSIFYKLDYSDRKITKFVTSQASPRIFGRNSTNEELAAAAPSAAYTLPYWINKGSNGSIWFNEHTGNKIAVFNPVNMTLIEYWIPTQNALFGQCQPTNAKNCGIANLLQFSVGNNNEVWFSEWSENKIGRVDTDKELPFSVSSSEKDVTIAKGKSAEIKLNLNMTSSSSSGQTINMIKSGTFTATGALGNSTGSFSEESFSIAPGKSKQISFIFTPSSDLKSGEYTLMVGAENNAISYLKAIKINII
jgi:virginiamycin B lyase